MAKKPKKTEKRKDPPKVDKKPEAKPRKVEPAAKVTIKTMTAEGEKVDRLSTILATIHARKTAATANRKAAFEDRNAIDKELAELGKEAETARTPAYLKLCADLTEVVKKIDKLDAQIKACNNSYDKLAKDCENGTFAFAEKSVDEILAESGKAKKDPQLTFGGDPPGVDSSWKQLYQFKPDFWPGKEWAQVGQHFGKIEAMETAGVPADNPLRLAEYIQHQFETLGETTDRAGILPAFPDWFTIGLRAQLAAALRGELSSPDDEAQTTDTESLARRLTDAADRDPDAWVNLCGGSDSPLNQALNAVTAT